MVTQGHRLRGEGEGCIDQKEYIVLYHKPPTEQGLAATSKSSTSLPVVGSDSQSCSSSMLAVTVYLYVGCCLLGPRVPQSSHAVPRQIVPCQIVLLTQYELL